MRLLGTSSAFVFLWDAEGKRHEVVPIQSIHRIRSAEPDPDEP